jgi:hypothetical protein
MMILCGALSKPAVGHFDAPARHFADEIAALAFATAIAVAGGPTLGVHISGDLLRHLRLNKPNRLCSLQRRGDGPQPLQRAIRSIRTRIRDRRTLTYRCREIGQHLVEAHHQTVR